MRLMRSSAQPLAPQHVSGVLGVHVRVNQELTDPVKPVPCHSRRARACPCDSWLSSPIRRRGDHVAPSCDLNTALLVPKWTSAVVNLISSGLVWYLHVESGADKWCSKSVASSSSVVSICSRHGSFLL